MDELQMNLPKLESFKRREGAEKIVLAAWILKTCSRCFLYLSEHENRKFKIYLLHLQKWRLHCVGGWLAAIWLCADSVADVPGRLDLGVCLEVAWLVVAHLHNSPQRAYFCLETSLSFPLGSSLSSWWNVIFDATRNVWRFGASLELPLDKAEERQSSCTSLNVSWQLDTAYVVLCSSMHDPAV